MGAAETIRAAIDKLEALVKATPTYEIQGDWLVDNVGHHTCAGGTAESNGMHERGCGYEPLTNDPIVVTLHRTIDAQLVILRGYIGTAEYWDKVRGTPADLLAILDLARAILGGVTPDAS